MRTNKIIHKSIKHPLSTSPFVVCLVCGFFFVEDWFINFDTSIKKINEHFKISTTKGFGISITTKVEKGESPLESADRLVSKEQRIRKSRYYSWIKSINKKTIN